MSAGRQALGRAGEQAARKYLKRSGLQILARNYRCPGGELDLVCHADGCIVFVEVKTLASDAAADPEEKITPAKQRRLERAARNWLARHREPDCAYRFDAVSVVIGPDGSPRVRHIVEAFLPRR